MPKKAESTTLGSTVMTIEPDDPFCDTKGERWCGRSVGSERESREGRGGEGREGGKEWMKEGNELCCKSLQRSTYPTSHSVKTPSYVECYETQLNPLFKDPPPPRD